MIEEKIKEEFDNYEIKTTSKMILEKRIESRRKLFRFPFILGGLTAGLACLILVILLIPHGNNDSGYLHTRLGENSLRNQVFLEVLYAGSMESDGSQLMANEISLNDYSQAVEKINSSYDLFEKINTGLDGIDIKYSKDEYKIFNKKYNYKYDILGYILYSKENIMLSKEIDFEGDVVIEINNNKYAAVFEIEYEEDELEVKLHYSIGNKEICVEREIEIGEFSYVYYEKNNGEKTLMKTLSIEEEDNEKSIEYTYENTILGFTLEIEVEIKNSTLITYKYRSSDSDIVIENIELVVSNDERTYTYLDYVIKK